MRLCVCLWMLLPLFAEVPAAAQPVSRTDEHALTKLCLDAKTPPQCRPAIPVCEQLVAMELLKPPSHEKVQAMHKLWRQIGTCQGTLGQYAGAERAYRECLTAAQRAYGNEHVEVARTLSSLADVLDRYGQVSQATALCQQALEMRTRLLGPEHPEIAESLTMLAYFSDLQGQHTRARALGEQGLSMRRKLLGPEHPDVAHSLNQLGLLFDNQGQSEKAEEIFRQALAIRTKALGREHLDVADSLNNLARSLKHRGMYAQAEAPLQEASEILRRALGQEHPDAVSALSNLASLYEMQGRHYQSEVLHLRVLELRRQVQGAEHPDVALSLNQLANTLVQQGQNERAEMLYLQSLEIRRKVLGPEHLDVAVSLGNLASMLARRGQYAQSEALFSQALDIRKKLLGPEHPAVIANLSSLAVLLVQQGLYARAELVVRQVLEFQRKVIGPEHPDTVVSLHNLAAVLTRQGQYLQAETYYEQAVALRKKLLGPTHPDVVKSLYGLVRNLLAQNKLSAALSHIHDATVIREGQLRATVSEARMQALLQAIREDEDLIYGLLLQADRDTVTLRLALSTALLRKGRALEAGLVANRLMHRAIADHVVQQRFADWQSLRQRRDAMLYGGPGKLAQSEYQTRLKEMALQSQALEAQLATDLPEIGKLHPPEFDAILPVVAKRLPRQSVLIEVVWARPFAARAQDEGSRWGAPHYIALLLFADQRVATVDLGLAAEVDRRSRALLAAIQSSTSSPVAAAQELYQQIFLPLLANLSTSTDLYLSLDGTLNLIPFDTLHDGQDYLLGRYRFHYLTSGRDLLRLPSARKPQAPLLVANPDFGQVDKDLSTYQSGSLYERLLSLPPLPGTQKEVETLAALIGGQVLTGTMATEQAISPIHSPQILHIATHGLFLREEELFAVPALQSPQSESTPQSKRSVTIGVPPPANEVAATNRSALQFPNNSMPRTERFAPEDGAMNRSALALAGVRHRHPANDTTQDGLLTAEEARSLDLDGTQLVTLSACETGQGTLSAGQGVYGLRRAFLIAGAETLVTSLWRVHDGATGELMELYYGKLLDKQRPGDRLGAMVEAMQELRRRPGRAHPYFWAPFLVIGQDGPIRP